MIGERHLIIRPGTLALGTKKGIEYWRMNPTSEVVVWDRLWEQPLPVPASVRISPASGHLAWFSEVRCKVNSAYARSANHYPQNQKSGYILTIDRKGQPVRVAQEIRHPREMQWIGWRNSAPGSDPFLFTITTNSVLRIYSPVLDDPVWFQLLYSLDHRSFNRDAHETSTKTKGKEPQSNPYGVMWVWDAKILKTVARKEPEKVKNGGEIQKVKDRAKVLEFIRAEESDVVAWISPDGSITLRSIVVSLPVSVSFTSLLTDGWEEHGQKTPDFAQIFASGKIYPSIDFKPILLVTRSSTALHSLYLAISYDYTPSNPCS